MSFTCAFCNRDLPDHERDDDLRGASCCKTCGPHEDDTRRTFRPVTDPQRPTVFPRRSPLTSIHSSASPVAGADFWNQGCTLCGQPRSKCCC